MITNRFLKLISIIFILTYSNITLANNPIYFVDINFLINNSLAGKSISNQLETKNLLLQKKLTKLELALKDVEQNIKSQKNILSEDEINKKIQSFNKEVEIYKGERKKLINNLTKSKNLAQKELNTSLIKIISAYSNKEGISYIIHKQSIIIGKTELDLTKKILKILDSEIKNITFK
ncbi:OmpH family outer membrane protein [Candidatus Pelagibacter sp. Uisw_092]|uniref:OmpH family outer membrane protein n=1 Tax=Candidatus Pelagibacter sp. Uisw_092 TaxID=3230979 RepID=UPI0039EB2D7A